MVYERWPLERAAALAAWILRIFGSADAYVASLPSRLWIDGAKDWTSIQRD